MRSDRPRRVLVVGQSVRLTPELAGVGGQALVQCHEHARTVPTHEEAGFDHRAFDLDGRSRHGNRPFCPLGLFLNRAASYQDGLGQFCGRHDAASTFNDSDQIGT